MSGMPRPPLSDERLRELRRLIRGRHPPGKGKGKVVQCPPWKAEILYRAVEDLYFEVRRLRRELEDVKDDMPAVLLKRRLRERN